MGGARHCLFTPDWAAVARAAAAGGGEVDSTAAKTLYLSRLLTYSRARQADCTLPRCSHCTVSLPPTRRRAAATRQRRWNDVWCRCAGCDAWMVRRVAA